MDEGYYEKLNLWIRGEGPSPLTGKMRFPTWEPPAQTRPASPPEPPLTYERVMEAWSRLTSLKPSDDPIGLRAAHDMRMRELQYLATGMPQTKLRPPPDDVFMDKLDLEWLALQRSEGK